MVAGQVMAGATRAVPHAPISRFVGSLLDEKGSCVPLRSACACSPPYVAVSNRERKPDPQKCDALGFSVLI